MKKFISIVTILCVIIMLSACGKKVTPKEALINTTNAKQGKMLLSIKLTTDTGNGPQNMKLLVNSIYGMDDNKKTSVESTLNANYEGKNLEAKFDINADVSQKEPRISMEAGIPVSTLKSFGADMPTPIVFTLSEADFHSLLKDQNIDFSANANVNSLKKNSELLQKILTSTKDLKIEKPKDAGSDTRTIEGSTYSGEKYTIHLNANQIKGLVKALAKLGLQYEKNDIKNNSKTKGAVPSEQELSKQLDAAFKTINLKDGINSNLIVDKNGYLVYSDASMDIKDPAGASEVKLEMELGYSDLDSSIKGLDYYNKNKTGMYQNATTIPLMQYLKTTAGGDSKKSGTSSTSLFGLGN